MLIRKSTIKEEYFIREAKCFLERNFDLSKLLLFDIETTGFSAKTSICYLIGSITYEDDAFQLIQWFAENPEEEYDVLNHFFKQLHSYEYMLNYNGNGFDIPYLAQKAKQYDLESGLKACTSIDIYKSILSYKSCFKLDNLKQRTVEEFLGLNRKDPYNGGELITVYFSFCETKSEEQKQELLLHNEEELCGLICLTPMLNYQNIFTGNFQVESLEQMDVQTYQATRKTEVIVTLRLPDLLPKRISNGYKDFYISCFQDKVKIKIPLYQNELKYFYPNHKDYYYLPEEDLCIHKSVAFYVDKNYRTKAKAATCYSKKTGRFLPQFEEIISPYFKIDYFDKITYFEVTESFFQELPLVKKYITHIVKYLH